jgi:hypothetical protein
VERNQCGEGSSACGEESRNVGVVSAVVLVDDQAVWPPIAEPVGGACVAGAGRRM